MEKLNKKSKANNVKPFMVKNHLWVFINAQIENPAFDSQVRCRMPCAVQRQQAATVLLHSAALHAACSTAKLHLAPSCAVKPFCHVSFEPNILSSTSFSHLLTWLATARQSSTLLQTKETLTIKASSFGSKCELTPQLMDKVAKCGVMDNILSFAAFKNQKELKKSDGAKRSRLVGELLLQQHCASRLVGEQHLQMMHTLQGCCSPCLS